MAFHRKYRSLQIRVSVEGKFPTVSFNLKSKSKARKSIINVLPS